ncbi:hypothetical protein [Anaeromyxobacter oryzae]|uniref:DUF1579 domain-containing protein n=1 Tax=Anaeromyxobacter oryzae TaxID=2918170 RepID=A0ABN6MT78_9BACT|nr:hypothetical protein [Anaeromyxobacter oryzae]BDG04175.1 hypothetical protein AMOR_31710 [Anaeromyxobacter oryzae]
MFRSMIFAAATILVVAGTVARAEDRSPVEPLGALVGTWDAEGGGTPGQGAGTVAFTREVGGHAVVRRNAVTYPATDGRPASTHEDLLVLHAEGTALKGLYVDGEGHVIHYAAAPGAAPGTLVLLSEPGPGPRFRLTHDWRTAGELRIVFEIAPPGSQRFKVYAEGRATRRRGP